MSFWVLLIFVLAVSLAVRRCIASRRASRARSEALSLQRVEAIAQAYRTA